MRKTFDVKMAVLALYKRLGSWRAVATHIGAYSPAYWSCVAKGMRPSRRAENALRRKFGLAPRGVRRLADMREDELRWYMRNRRPLAPHEDT